MMLKPPVFLKYKWIYSSLWRCEWGVLNLVYVPWVRVFKDMKISTNSQLLNLPGKKEPIRASDSSVQLGFDLLYNFYLGFFSFPWTINFLSLYGNSCDIAWIFCHNFCSPQKNNAIPWYNKNRWKEINQGVYCVWFESYGPHRFFWSRLVQVRRCHKTMSLRSASTASNIFEQIAQPDSGTTSS